MGKIQIITYIYNQNEFLTKISPKPIKTAVKKYIHNYYTKYIELSKLVLCKLFDGNYVQIVPLIITASSHNIIE